MKCAIKVIPYQLDFKFLAGTSRGVLKKKTSYYIFIKDDESGLVGIGEAGPLKGLSLDDLPDFERVLNELISRLANKDFPNHISELPSYLEDNIPSRLPSIRFGVEMAIRDLLNNGKRIIFDNPFSRGVRSLQINGLIWMGDSSFMIDQLEEKLEKGFSCLKMKIGAIDFSQECSIIETIRKRFSAKEIELRVDANGAFTPKNAYSKLETLSQYDLHSIEQPIRQGQILEMKRLCRDSSLNIALDEELIGLVERNEKEALLDFICPQYIILKPTLLGGFGATAEWIHIANQRNIKWWITSALESNIGLNAIAQFTGEYNNKMPQGLGTGQIYNNNISSPLTLVGDQLSYRSLELWDLNPIDVIL